MSLAQNVCLVFTVLTAFGMGLTTGKNDGLPRWQVCGYVILILAGMSGVFYG